MNVAQDLVSRLRGLGITHCFGIIGAGNLTIYEALAQAGTPRIIAVHHEQAAAMAAAYYWRTCRRLAPVLPTTGGGSSNTLTGVIAAWQDSIPLLVISGNEPSRYFPEKCRVVGVQGYRSWEIPWVKWGVQLTEPSKLGETLQEAVHTALTGRPGPVWLDIPRDVQGMEVPSATL